MDLQTCKERLEANRFTVKVFETKAEAADYLDQSIDEKTVGMGGSMSLAELNTYERLSKHNTVYSHQSGGDPDEQRKQAATADVYLLSANAIDGEKGQILNIDGVGNRVSASLYGHEKVVFVAGKNKVSPDFATAYDRLRNVVAPKNAQRLHRKTPCAEKADKCYDCSSPERICNGLVVLYKCMRGMEMEVILVNEDLGY